MPAAEYAKLTGRLGNAIQAARDLGVSIRQHYYYTTGHTPVPLTVERLLCRLVKDNAQSGRRRRT